MSTSSPSLSVEQTHHLRWWLGACLALVATGSSLLLGAEFVPIGLVALCLQILALIRPAWIPQVPRWGHRLAFPVALTLLVADYALRHEVVPALLRLGLFLLTYRAWTVRRRRDDLQLIVLGLFVLIMTGLLTLSPAFGLALLVFTFLTLGLLTVRTLQEAAEVDEDQQEERLAAAAHSVSWAKLWARIQATTTRRALALWSAICLAVFPLAALIFLSLPRFEMSRSLYLERMLARRGNLGFTETVNLGEITRLKADDSTAFHFDPQSPLPPLANLYWRMVTLDEYRDQTFRTSTALRAYGFTAASVLSRVKGNPRSGEGISGTFYLEPGVGRYLPLTGDFQQLDFADPREFRRAPAHHHVALSRAPSSMMAYRVVNMDTSARLAASRFIIDPRAVVAQTALHLGPDELSQLTTTVRTFGAPPGDRAGFVRLASEWLHQRHGYTLAPSLPPGSGDPLVRWMHSDLPGHCELFAGSLVLLCRAQGIPARLVAGFAGGAEVDRFIIVRNRDAHAWVEFELQPGVWVRTDPTAASFVRDTGETVAIAEQETSPSLWAGALERLRVAWYRRIVNFDDTDQVKLLRDAEKAAKIDLHAASTRWSELSLAARSGWIAGGVGTFALVFAPWLLRRWRQRPSLEARQRAQASRWLQRLRTVPAASEGLAADLRRIRYGATAHWPEPGAVFREARRCVSGLATRP